ncbi:uncharacterized protein LOC113323464 isoform X2 [Papaver somniferum]|uniref:uncharacterized protein LOC113323464 isoform X2 n=1 Tax=Papaver somniferum TaxID=3469 RepID=UPI000E70033A|nr:uncharacterized protein LOC113323464 isoform X2 [Papaver somniferum]
MYVRVNFTPVIQFGMIDFSRFGIIHGVRSLIVKTCLQVNRPSERRGSYGSWCLAGVASLGVAKRCLRWMSTLWIQMLLTFVREIEEFGSRKTMALCPGWNNIVVNSKNKNWKAHAE